MLTQKVIFLLIQMVFLAYVSMRQSDIQPIRGKRWILTADVWESRYLRREVPLFTAYTLVSLYFWRLISINSPNQINWKSLKLTIWNDKFTEICSGGSRISPRRGANSPGGANIWFCQMFLKTAWNWNNLDPQGVLVPGAPLRSATVFLINTNHVTFNTKYWAVQQRIRNFSKGNVRQKGGC